MSLFRRRPESGETAGPAGLPRPGLVQGEATPAGKKTTQNDRFVLRAGPDGLVREPCWFCGRELEVNLRQPTTDVAVVMIEPLGDGERSHGICHRACVQRARDAIAGS